MSTIKPDEGLDTPEIWRRVVRLFEHIKRTNPMVDEYGYWQLSEEQTEQFMSITHSGSLACIIAWQDVYKQLSQREIRNTLRTPKEARHLRIVKNQDDK